MAWQNSTAMGGNGGGPGGVGEGGNNGGQPQGTEYTLQGADAFIIFHSRSSIGSTVTSSFG